MKLTKCGTLVNKTTYLFTSMRDSNNSRRCAKNLEFSGRGGGGGVNFGGQSWKIQRGRGSCSKSLPWGWYGYFLEPHSVKVHVLLKRFHMNGYNIQYMQDFIHRLKSQNCSHKSIIPSGSENILRQSSRTLSFLSFKHTSLPSSQRHTM